MRIIALAVAAFAFAAPAFAQDEEPPCMAPIAITAEVVRHTAMYGYAGEAAAGARPAFIIGLLSPTRYAEDADDVSGSVVFVRSGDGAWRAFIPRNGETVMVAFGADDGAMMLATMWASEAPGGSWTLLRSSDGLQTGACQRVDFPGSLNQPMWDNDFVSMHDFDIDRHGRGEIIGSSGDEEVGIKWWLYRTRNGGETWSAPRQILSGREARAGSYTPIAEQEPPAALLADLNAYAASR